MFKVTQLFNVRAGNGGPGAGIPTAISSTRYYSKYYAGEGGGEVDSGRRTGMEQLHKAEWSVPIVRWRESATENALQEQSSSSHLGKPQKTF